MISVHVPATSANCCVGFDSLGMAVDWFAHFHFEPSDKLIIEGCLDEFKNPDNLVCRAFYLTCDHLNLAHPTFKLTIDSDIPFSRGLGSSSTCIVAGILACDAWFDAKLSDDEKLTLATKLEGHPDNVAPALFGKMTACIVENDKIYMTKFDLPDYACLAMVINYPVKTSDARKVLPKMLEHKVCASQAAHAMIFLQALINGDERLAFVACKDKLHEPYRKQFIKEYDQIKAYCDDLGICMWISGSGSTLLAISQDKAKLAKLDSYCKDIDTISTRYVSISKKGAYVDEQVLCCEQ